MIKLFRHGNRLTLISRVMLSPRSHPLDQLDARIGIRRQAVFELRLLDRRARVQAELAVRLTDLVAGAEQQRLQLAPLLEGDLRDGTAALAHGGRPRRAAWRSRPPSSSRPATGSIP